MTQSYFSRSPAEWLKGLQAQPELLCSLDPPRDPVEKPRGDGGNVKKSWACSSTAEWDSAPGQTMMSENPEVLHFQHPSPAQGEDFYPPATYQQTEGAAEGKESTEKF